MLHADRYFSPDSGVRTIARELYEKVVNTPLICPHGHVDPKVLSENAPFPDPAKLIITPDHYIFRMLYSQGLTLEQLGIRAVNGAAASTDTETDSRKIWQTFAEHIYLFRGTPTSCWLKHEFAEVFGIEERLTGDTAMAIYDAIAGKLNSDEFLPRQLYERFNIELLATTDAATDTLEEHIKIRDSGWKGKVIPTFRPDSLVNLLQSNWKSAIDRLSELVGSEVTDFQSYLRAIESRRAFFKSVGATATDHGVSNPYTHELSSDQVDGIFQRALQGTATEEDNGAFCAHMLIELARMSVDDGLVMQIHPGSSRNHNQEIFEKFGPDKGCDIPHAVEFTRNLKELLNKFGNNPKFRLVLFTLDESTYSRELAPLAGHYPAVRLGPPWWFQDSIEGMRRFRRSATETAGIYNTAGFNDDTRAFPSIPARHDLCRRVDANFLAELVCEHVIDRDEAEEIIVDLTYNLVKDTYRL